MSGVRRWGWLACLVVGAAAIGPYFSLSGGIQSVFYNLFGVGVVAAIVGGVWVNRPGRPLVWYLLAFGQFALLVGDVYFHNYASIFGGKAPFPSLADVFYLAAYPLVIAALLLMIRNRAPGRDRSSLLDAMIVTLGVGVFAWVFVVEPYTQDLSVAPFERYFSVVYPLLSLLMFAVLVRLVTTFRERVPSYRLLALGVFCFVVADITYGALELTGSYQAGSIVDVGWLLSYVLLGSAALHPSMRVLSERATGSAARALTWRRLVLLAAASLAAPAMIVIEEVRGERANVSVMAGVAAVLFLLVLLRMEGLLRRLKVASERYESLVSRERALGRVGTELMVALTREDVYRVALKAALELSGGASGVRASIMAGPLTRLVVVASAGEGAGEAEGARIDAGGVPDIVKSYRERRVVEAGRVDGDELRGSLGFEPKGGAILIGPLLVQGESEGVISAATDGAFPEDFRDGFRALASQVSLALEGVILAERTYRREGEERFKSLIQNSTDMITVVDREGYVLYQSPSFGRVMGYEDRLGVNIHSSPIVHPDDYGLQRALIERAIAAPESSPMGEVRLRRNDGSWRYVEATYTSLLDDPNVGGIVLNSRDVTERKRAEQKFREAHQRLGSHFENSPVGVVEWDRETRVLSWSREAERIFGWRAEEVVGSRLTDLCFVHEDDREAVGEAVVDRLLEGRENRLVFRNRNHRKDGSIVHCEWYNSVLVDDRGELVSVMSLALDVTEGVEAERALKESERRFKQLFDQSVDTLLLHDEAGNIVDCNDEACFSLGYTREELLGLSVKDFAGNLASNEGWRSEEGGSLWQRTSSERINAITSGFHLAEHRRKDGSTFPVEVHVGAVDYGGKRMMLAAARDITELKRAAEALREAETKYRTLVERIPAVTYVDDLDRDSAFAYASPRIQALLGYPAEDWCEDPLLFEKTLHDEDRDRVLAEYARVSSSGDPLRTEYRMVHRDGRVVWVQDEAFVLRDEQGRLSVRQGFMLDITERKALEEQLAHQAFHDSLTGLPNRALFADRLGHALVRLDRRDGALAVLFLDLDDFKTVNDSLGHTAGDELLVEVARRISSCIRQSDTVARLGGDEFAILLEEGPAGEGLVARAEVSVAERVLEALGVPCVLEGKEITIKPSIGIAIGKGPEGAEELLRNADVAMYTAKNRGKGRYEFYDPEMHAAVLERLDLRADLRRAVEGEEFIVHYQPIIALTGDGEDAGYGLVREVEALVRWEHPERGLIPPGKFIPLAEETGIIVEIGLQVLREACRQVRAWRDDLPGDHVPPTLNANLSACQFRQPNLVEQIQAVLRETDLPPSFLKLEVTESVAMEDVEAALVTLRRLKDLGIRVAIDDFGTGYSSLSYLRRFPVDNLKIDRSFVGRLEEDSESAAIVATTVSLARTLGLEVTAEGVETAGQLACLRELGCDLAQGYYFSRPLPAGPVFGLLGSPLAQSGERQGV